MESIIEKAEQENIINISLQPSQKFGSDFIRLINFYKKLGFVFKKNSYNMYLKLDKLGVRA